jgi:hypothetical protein
MSAAKRLETKRRCIWVILGASAHYPFDRKVLGCSRRPPAHAAAAGGLVLGDQHHAIDILARCGSGNSVGRWSNRFPRRPRVSAKPARDPRAGKSR